MAGARTSDWPALSLDQRRSTYETLHRWTQIVGKVRLARTPWINHSWHVTLYVTARGLTTWLIPCGPRSLQIDFDFLEHQLALRCDDGGTRSMALRPRSVADFYRELMANLHELGVETAIYPRPNELDDATPFDQDEAHCSYDPEAANRFWRVLVQAERVLMIFRARFQGKCSPVHFFWGSFDLAVTRFSGRPAPPHPGGVPHLPDWVVRDAYSHEVSSAGFWPGDARFTAPAFYSYAYPEPAGFPQASVRAAGAFYSTDLREFLLPYDQMRTAGSPDDALLDFLQSTYRAAADLGRWDRPALERAEIQRKSERE
ncbi:MAG TPA: DUF5996 family protein [Tepidisphaeraceae bacterium]|nr:DUF5996 family protein [Tepidisphaeraceae bacterium]